MNIKRYQKEVFDQIAVKKELKKEILVKFGLKAITDNLSKNTKSKWKQYANQLTDTIYASLEETLTLVLKLVKEGYGIEKTDKLDIKNLTWQKDNKTLDERVLIYCEQIYLELQINENPNVGRIKRYLTYSLNRLIDNETAVIRNNALHQLLAKYSDEVEIISGQCCEYCDEYFNEGRMPIEQLKEIPPLHPSCDCSIIYYLKHNKGEVEIQNENENW